MKLGNLLQNLSEIEDRQRRIDPINRPYMSARLADTEQSFKVRDTGLSTQFCFRLELNLAVEYWANQAQKSDARKNAEAALQDALYRDVVGRLAQIRFMLDSCDRHAAQLAITELMSEMRP